MVLFLLACTANKDDSLTPAPIPQGPALALVSDTANQRFTLTRLDEEGETASISLSSYHADFCTSESPCLTFGAQHSIDSTTQDDLVTGLYEPIGLSTHLEQFRITPGEISTNWHLETLDFSAFPDLCPTRCPGAGGGDLPRACFLAQAHSFVILEDTPTEVKALIADTGTPDRLIWVTLDKSQTCATVDRVFDIEPYDHTNDVEVWEESGRTFVMMSHFAATEEKSDDGASKITLLEDDGTTLSPLWTFPETGYLSAVHNPDRIVENEQTYIIYAHSNGNGDHLTADTWTPTQDHLGSVGVLSLENVEQAPTYLGEITTSGLGFSRDTSYYDGSVLVTDSGCFNSRVENCPHEGALWKLPLDLEQMQAPGLTGSFPDQQQITEVSPASGFPVHCGYHLSFSAEYLVEDFFGTGLKERMAVHPATCQ